MVQVGGRNPDVPSNGTWRALAITCGRRRMIEGKAEDRANDPEVMAKKAAGFEWARFANDSGDAPGTEHSEGVGSVRSQARWRPVAQNLWTAPHFRYKK